MTVEPAVCDPSDVLSYSYTVSENSKNKRGKDKIKGKV